ncbi:hypothetical protein GAYE_SCF47G5897 [Galdieria yellowstonensis]|uniref:dolichol kinase n=1 Tax=Galdieria yellowstonensis TaxID=3028027 RepID=A0AAV9IL06_9RHOD|nr:hypothetical protein GAYE_SCF47G5897 [Galdieria yellowstonensis]
MSLHARSKKAFVMTQPSLLWFLSNKFSLIVEDVLVFVAVLLYFVAGRRIHETLTRQASVLALAVGSIYLRPVVETVISFSFGAVASSNTNHIDIPKSRPLQSPLRPYADSGLTVGICLFPLLFVPTNGGDKVAMSLLFAVCVASGVFVLVSIASGNFDDLDKTPPIVVMRELLLSFLLSLVCCYLYLPPQGDVTTLFLVATMSCLFPVFMRICIYCLRGSFSMAEAIIISESSLCVLVYAVVCLQTWKNDAPIDDTVRVLHYATFSLAITTVLFLFGYSYLFSLLDGNNRWRGKPRRQREPKQENSNDYSLMNTCCFFGYFVVVLLLCYFWLTCFVVRPEKIIFGYFLTSWSAICLAVYWIAMLCFVLFLLPPHHLSLAPIVARKYYHLVLFFILLPSLFLQAAFVGFCSIVALLLLVLVELGRASHVYGIRWLVNDYMSALIDHRDNGTIYMTHLYLLLGSCFPLWCQNHPCSLLGMSGIVTLGVVDTATACLGTFYGKRKWPGTLKTMEGTFSGMLLGICCCYLLYMQCKQSTSLDSSILFVLTTSYLLSTLLEAFTTQIDNLVVPLYHYVILRQCIIIAL